MMDGHRESRKRLRPWLERMIGNKNCPGLVWENKELRTFRIPWRHFNNRDWHEKDSQIFMEWAKYTGKYDGVHLEYPVWKTRLRCALTKIPEIKELPEQHHLEDPNPYRVYQFVDAPLMKKSCDIDSDYSASPGSSASLLANSPSTVKDFLEESMTPPPPPKYFDEPFLNPKPLINVPTVVYENDQFNYNNLGIKTEPACSSHFSVAAREPPNCHPQVNNHHFERGYPGCDPFNIPEKQNFLQQMHSATPNYSNLNLSPSHQELHMLVNETSEGVIGMQVELDSVKRSLPSDLRSVEISDLMHLSSDNNLSLSGIQDSEDFLQSDPVMQITLMYGYPHHTVLVKNVAANGCRLYFGAPEFPYTFMEEEMFGPRTVTQIEIPDVKEHKGISDEQKMFISELLDNMQRGIILTYKDDCIYAQRLCTNRVFFSDGVESRKLDRKLKTPIKVFDYSAYKAAFENYDHTNNSPVPVPYVYLTIGQEVKMNHCDPMRRVLIHAKVLHTEAAKFVSKLPLDSGNSLVPLLSSYDTYDYFLQGFKNMAVKNN